MRDDSKIEEMVLEAKEEAKPISYEDSSPIQSKIVKKINKSVCVEDNVNFELGFVGPHSKHFFTLCFDDILSVELSKIVEDYENEEQHSYILYFTFDKQHKNTTHFKAKLFTMHHPLLGFLIFAPPPYERGKKMDSKLEVKFISSRWRKK